MVCKIIVLCFVKFVQLNCFFYMDRESIKVYFGGKLSKLHIYVTVAFIFEVTFPFICYLSYILLANFYR